MSTADILTLIQDSAVAHAISKSNHLVGASLQVVHVVGIIALLAALVLIALRLTGLTLRDQPVFEVVRDADRLLHIGLVLTIASGVLMFIATPKLYFYKPVFGLKMILFLAAVGIQFTLLRRLTLRDSANTAGARAAVAFSVLAWFSVAFAGRMIGFT